MSGGKCPGGTCPGGFCPVIIRPQLHLNINLHFMFVFSL